LIGSVFMGGGFVVCYSRLADAGDKENVWFSPDGASPDLLQLFQAPNSWRRTRKRIDVIKLGPLRLTSHSGAKDNSFEELAAAGAFKLVKRWGLALAAEEGAIKPWDCTGTQAAQVTLKHVIGVNGAGCTVNIVAMDEPFSSAKHPCNLSVGEAARRTAGYVHLVQSGAQGHNDENIVVGDIEPYPSLSVKELEQWTESLISNGFKPAFFHLDINAHYTDLTPAVDLKGDLQRLQAYFREKEVPFGVIIWSGYDPLNSDKAYYDHAMNLVEKVKNAIHRPNQLVFQSWVTRSTLQCSESTSACLKQPCGPNDPPYCSENSIPLNLPEDDRHTYSHLRLVNDGLNEFGKAAE
jgi:hypothetical protein